MKKAIYKLCISFSVTLSALFLLTSCKKTPLPSLAQEQEDTSQVSSQAQEQNDSSMLPSQTQVQDDSSPLPQSLIDSYYAGQSDPAFEYVQHSSIQKFLGMWVKDKTGDIENPEWNYGSFTKVGILDRNLGVLQTDNPIYSCTFSDGKFRTGYIIVEYDKNGPDLSNYGVKETTPYVYDLKANMAEINESLSKTDIDMSTAKAARVVLYDKENKSADQGILFTDNKGDNYIGYFGDSPFKIEKWQAGKQKAKPQEMPEVYLNFLKGTGSAVTADWYNPGDGYSGAGMVEKGKEYTLKQLESVIIADKDWQDKYEEDMEYALLDSENDGEVELAVRLNHVGIDGPDDTSTTTLILKEADKTLLLCDAFDTWNRSEDTQYFYGFRDGGGSSGAGDHSYEANFIDGKGVKQQIYQCRSVGGYGIFDVNEKGSQDYNEIYNGELPDGLVMDVYTIGGKDYFVYNIEYSKDEQQKTKDEEMVKTLIACYNKQGAKFLTNEEIQKLIDERKQELGIKESWCEKKELDWHKASDLCS